ncbi:MAG TPA: hypothetical protein VK856_09925 [Anaerolineaceae bacterium]|nr:hypothetical protein [Anaerolineaceae bacterium]
MKLKIFSVTIVLVLLVVVSGQVVASSLNVNDPAVLKDLAAVRNATARYHNVENALADGFVADIHCVAEPGLGGMGLHYVHLGRLTDGEINLLEPEILLYAPSGNGVKLVGVEYMLGIGPPDGEVPDDPDPAPVLFGREFDGPMVGHGPGQPPHYDLHVWVWQPNPSGMFAMFNPNVGCD